MPHTCICICLHRIDPGKRNAKHFRNNLFLHTHIIISHIMRTCIQNTTSILIHLQHQSRNISMCSKTVVSMNTKRHSDSNSITIILCRFLFLANFIIIYELHSPLQTVLRSRISMWFMETRIQTIWIYHIFHLQFGWIHM